MPGTPKRLKHWHQAAAVLRARGWKWSAIAAWLGFSPWACRHLVRVPGFGECVLKEQGRIHRAFLSGMNQRLRYNEDTDPLRLFVRPSPSRYSATR